MKDWPWVINESGLQGPWTIMLAYRGSYSHGTYVPPEEEFSTDDVDLMGIVVPDPDYYVGLKEYGSRGTVEIKDDPYDVVLYESRKAVGLLAKGNPNIVNMLWLPEEMYLVQTGAGDYLKSCRNAFVTKALYQPFRGYARSQLEKMEDNAFQGYMGDKRKVIVERFGYDTKNASHLIRLLRQGVEFFEHGEMVVDRRAAGDADELIEIKQGAWTLELVKEVAAQLDDDLETAWMGSSLPSAPDWDVVNAIARETYNIHREETA
jgi:predicted nucleotidyltransferase